MVRARWRNNFVLVIFSLGIFPPEKLIPFPDLSRIYHGHSAGVNAARFLRIHRRDKEYAEWSSTLPSAPSAVMRKNPKIIKNYKFCLNEIKYLQLLIFAKRDFFSRPASLR
jgi:hypothetical protein